MSDPTVTPKARLYYLLPEIYRLRDRQNGQALQALLAVFEEKLDEIEHDINAVYDDQFIETCTQEIVPYIGDLVGANLATNAGKLSTMRSYVGNLIGYRRRKGLPGVLTHVVHDVTGWGVRSASTIRTLNATEALNVCITEASGTINIRDTAVLGTLDSPDDRSNRTAEIRVPRQHVPLGMQRGRHNANGIGIFIFRLNGYPTELTEFAWHSTNDPANGPAGWFHPFGIDMPMFEWVMSPSPRQTAHSRETFSVAQPLTRARLALLLTRARLALSLNRRPPVMPFRILYPPTEGSKVYNVTEIQAWDLSTWSMNGFDEKARVAVDPELGRIMLSKGTATTGVRVSSTYGFSGDMGGGPYIRANACEETKRLFLVGPYEPSKAEPSGTTNSAPAITTHATLNDAIAKWKAWSADEKNQGIAATIRIVDSRTYHWGGDAATWIKVDLGANALTIEAENGQRPCVFGDLFLSGITGAHVRFDGLLWRGKLIASGPFVVEIADSTILPPLTPITPSQPPSLTSPGKVSAGKTLDVRIERSIVGAIRMARTSASLRVTDSIVDASGEAGENGAANASPNAENLSMTMTLGVTDGVFALRGPDSQLPNHAAAPTVFERTTVIGEVYVASLRAEDTLFTKNVQALSNDGYARHCYVPEGSRVPPMSHSLQSKPGPMFTSLRYGNPAYCQLDGDTPIAILEGASNGAEIGAFQRLNGAERVRNLERVLDAYVPLTLEARILYVT